MFWQMSGLFRKIFLGKVHVCVRKYAQREYSTLFWYCKTPCRKHKNQHELCQKDTVSEIIMSLVLYFSSSHDLGKVITFLLVFLFNSRRMIETPGKFFLSHNLLVKSRCKEEFVFHIICIPVQPLIFFLPFIPIKTCKTN